MRIKCIGDIDNAVCVFERKNGVMPSSYALVTTCEGYYGDIAVYCPVSYEMVRRYFKNHQNAFIPGEHIECDPPESIGDGWRRWGYADYISVVPYGEDCAQNAFAAVWNEYLAVNNLYVHHRSIRQGKSSKYRLTIVPYKGKYGEGVIIKTYKTDTMSYWTYCIHN